MMENSELIALVLLGVFVYFFILYHVVRSATRSANKGQTYNSKIMNRLKIKELERMGVPKKDLLDLHNQSNDEFWSSIKD